MHEEEDVEYEFDWDQAVEWAIEDAINRGCTCVGEPEVQLVNCEQHGVHLSHIHETECEISVYAERSNQLLMAPWN